MLGGQERAQIDALSESGVPLRLCCGILVKYDARFSLKGFPRIVERIQYGTAS